MRKLLLSLTMLMAGAMAVWAQTEYVVSANTGTFNANWAKQWTSNDNPAGLKLITTNEAGNMQGNGDEMHIYSGKGVLECTYRLSVDLPYQITGYSYKYVDSGSTHDKTISIGETTYDVTTEVQTISVDGLATQTTDFTLTGANEKVTLTEFKVIVTKLPAVPVNYKYMYGESVWHTEEVEVVKGMSYPTTTAPYGVTLTFPEGNVPEDITEDAEIEISCALAQDYFFQFAADYSSVEHWYYLNIAANAYYLYYAESDTQIELTETDIDDNNKDAYTWAFVGNPFVGYQIYNRAAGNTKILSSSTTMSGSTGNGTHPILTTTPVPVGNNSHWVPTKSTNRSGVNGFYLAQKDNESNKMNNRDNVLAYWNGGADAGSTFAVVERPMNIETAFAIAIANAQSAYDKANTNVGKLGYYTQASVEALHQAINAAKLIVEPTQNDVEALEAAIEALEVVVPQAGKFYRIMNEGGSGYLDSKTGTGRTQFTAGIGEKASSIFYYTGEKLVSYTTGFYLANVNNFVHYTETVGEAAGTTFSFSKSPVLGKLYITFNGDRSFYSAGTGDSNAGSNGTGENYRFTVSEVTWLPVEINPEVGYATLFSPVQLGFNGRVTAYTGTKGEGWLTLTEQTVVPANKGVLLTFESNVEVVAENDKKYVYLPVQATNVTEVKSDLTGFTETKETFGNPYTLQRHDFDGDGKKESVAFKKFTGASANLLTGFKAYLDLPTEANAIGIRFEDGTTGIENSELNVENSELIFDLMGRRVETMTEGGIYIVNGKKVVIK